VGYLEFDPAVLGVGRYVAYGTKWQDGGSPAVILTYSFPGSGGGSAYFTPDYGFGGTDNNEWVKGGVSQWSPLNAAEQAAVKQALGIWSCFANVTFVATADNAATVGELRFGFSSTLGNDAAAHAYYPWWDPSAGDVWFNPDSFNTARGAVSPGSYDFHTILHEVGHALGLKHSFEIPNAAPAALDNNFYTIMSYTASPWSAHGDSWASFYPTTPMYYDLVAIEAMYGQRAFNTGNDSYVYNDGVKYWQAINDTAGVDRIVYNGAEAATINLNVGQFSSLSEAIQFQRPNGTLTSSKSTVTIGPNVVIENAVGGNGNDLLIGNTANNVLNGGAGADTLRPIHGIDTLTGGAGNDVFFFDTNPGNANWDRITDYVPANDGIRLENAIFTKLPVGVLNPAFFRAGAAAVDGNDFRVYARNTGKLFYDANANAAGFALIVAHFATKPLLTAAEFAVV
jgi:serralysin